MALVRWTPRRLRDPIADAERVFDTVWPAFFAPTHRDVAYPALEVRETADEVEVSAELPGLTDKDIQVDVEDNVLSLKGEKKHAHEEKDENTSVYYAERRYGAFERSITLPARVQADKARAAFKNGVLTVALPKQEDERARRIDVAVE